MNGPYPDNGRDAYEDMSEFYAAEKRREERTQGTDRLCGCGRRESLHMVSASGGAYCQLAEVRMQRDELLAAARMAIDVIGGTSDGLGLKIEAEKAYIALFDAISKAEGR